jgi:Holliday junction resolvase RusA-like endonuclease
MEINWEQSFENNEILFKIKVEPVSIQNKQENKDKLKHKFHQITKTSPYILTDTCFIDIDYFCNYYKRYKNHGSYDIDNIIKPILDSLNGMEGLIIDDYLFDRVSVNWIDKNDDEDVLQLRIFYPELPYVEKEKLTIYKCNNWCFPFINIDNENVINVVKRHFETWNKIKNGNDYLKYRSFLPLQRFIPYNKLKDKQYKFIEI